MSVHLLLASSVKTSGSAEDSLLERSHETIRSLLACINACAQQSDLFTLATHGTPLVGATSTHIEMLTKIDASCVRSSASMWKCSGRHSGVQVCECDGVGNAATSKHSQRPWNFSDT